MQIEINHFKQRIIKVFIITFILLLAIVYLSYSLTKYYTETQFLKISEQKSLSELDLYHEGIRKITQERLEDKINVIETLSKSTYLYQALINNRINEVEDIFKQILNSKNNFDMLVVLDNKGKLITISGLPEEPGHTVIYGNYSERDYFKIALKTEKTYVSKIFKAYGDYYVVAISTPVFDASGKIKYIVTGSDKLENLVDEFNFKTRFANLFSVLVDQEGNMLVKDSQSLKEIVNIANKDAFVKSFIQNNDEEKFSIQVNFNRDLSYIRGSRIKLKDNKFYLFSYLPYYESQKGLIELKEGVAQLYLIVFAGTIIVFVLGWFMSLIIDRDLIRKLK